MILTQFCELIASLAHFLPDVLGVATKILLFVPGSTGVARRGRVVMCGDVWWCVGMWLCVRVVMCGRVVICGCVVVCGAVKGGDAVQCGDAVQWFCHINGEIKRMLRAMMSSYLLWWGDWSLCMLPGALIITGPLGDLAEWPLKCIHGWRVTLCLWRQSISSVSVSV